jgi:hypothetical protein
MSVSTGQSYGSFMMDNASSINDDGSEDFNGSVDGSMEEDEDDNNEGGQGGIHAAAQQNNLGNGLDKPDFSGFKSSLTWYTASSLFGPNGKKPVHVVVIEFDPNSFEKVGGRISLDSLMNVDKSDMGDSNLRREAEITLVSLLIKPTAGGNLANGTLPQESEEGSSRGEQTYNYMWKDASANAENVSKEYPCFTIHIENVVDTKTSAVAKYRLWYMVWDPKFLIARSISQFMSMNRLINQSAHSRSGGKKKVAARTEIGAMRNHTMMHAETVCSPRELCDEFEKYFGDRNPKLNNGFENLPNFEGMLQEHPCAFENMLNPRDEQTGHAVLNSMQLDPSIHIHDDQTDPNRYFDANGRFYPPPFVRTNELFHTLNHKYHTYTRDPMTVKFPMRSMMTSEAELMCNLFYQLKLKQYGELSMIVKSQCFEAYLAGKDYTPSNRMASINDHQDMHRARYEFSAIMHMETYRIEDGKRIPIEPLKELRKCNDRLGQLIGGMDPEDLSFDRSEIDKALRQMVIENFEKVVDQRKVQLSPGTRHCLTTGAELMQRRGNPLSKMYGAARVEGRSMFANMVERLYVFYQVEHKSQDPMICFLHQVNSLAASLEGCGFALMVYGPSGKGKSRLEEITNTMNLPGMDVEAQSQSRQAQKRNNPNNGFHTTHDEPNEVVQDIKVKHKTADQITRQNEFKRKITMGNMIHSVSEQTTSSDGAKLIQDAEYYTLQGQSTTYHMNSGSRCGTTHNDDHTVSMLNRFKYYPMLYGYEKERARSEIDMTDPNYVARLEDHQKNDFLTRVLLILSNTSSIFETDTKFAEIVFRRMDMADGRAPEDTSRDNEHRMTVLRIVNAMYAQRCVFEFTNYHSDSIMAPLFEPDGKPKPFSYDMMTLCIPFLKSPPEDLIQFVWHLHDTTTFGRGPVHDEVMNLLVKESGLYTKAYSELSPEQFEKAYEDEKGDEKNKDKKEIEKAKKLKVDMYRAGNDSQYMTRYQQTFAPYKTIGYHDLRCIYSDDDIKTIKEEVKNAMEKEKEKKEPDMLVLNGLHAKEETALGLCNFLKEKYSRMEKPVVNFDYIQLGYSDMSDLANKLQHFSKYDIREELIHEQLVQLVYGTNAYKSKTNTTSKYTQGETKFCYKMPEAAPEMVFEEEWIRVAVEKYKMFPAVHVACNISGLSSETEKMLSKLKGASTEQSAKRQNAEGQSLPMEKGLCVQTAAIKRYMHDEIYAQLYAKTNEAAKNAGDFLYRHALGRASMIANQVFQNANLITPYFIPKQIGPLFVNTESGTNKAVWSTSANDFNCEQKNKEMLTIVNGKEIELTNATNFCDSEYDSEDLSTLWTMHTCIALNEWGDEWIRVVNDSRTNSRAHTKKEVFKKPAPKAPKSNAGNSSAADASLPPRIQKKTIAPLQ